MMNVQTHGVSAAYRIRQDARAGRSNGLVMRGVYGRTLSPWR